jgi:hypothetical protein
MGHGWRSKKCEQYAGRPFENLRHRWEENIKMNIVIIRS